METEKLYYADPFLTDFTATVLDCQPGKNGYLVTLDRTAFYPEGGGQPADHGVLDRAAVTDVHEKNGVILHNVDRAVEIGKTVTGAIDWGRRFDHMQQHSGEHICSGLICERFHCDNVGFHMGADIVTIDFNADISWEELLEIEAKANQYLYENHPIDIQFHRGAELEAIDYRSKKALEGDVRIVAFPGADCCACCGTHVLRSGQVGLVKFLSVQKFREGVRIELLCGKRALEYLSKTWEQAKAIGQRLSVKPVDSEAAVERLEGEFFMVAPDLRCFGGSDTLPVDATRGMRDFSDDIHELVEALGWDTFSILGWSMGGGVAMQYAIDHSERLEAIVLQSPLSPFGFGGTYGVDGKKLEPLGLASGAGCANAQLIAALQTGGRAFIGSVIDSIYVTPGFKIEPALKEKFIDSVLTTRVGDGFYPGDSSMCGSWPFVVAGSSGICNTMAPNWCDLSGLADIPNKPPILWIRGEQDLMVSDTSACDLAFLGKAGLVPGYPGEEVCPPQPMLSQTRFVLDKYSANGGSYHEAVIPGGHGCMLDHEDEFIYELRSFF